MRQITQNRIVAGSGKILALRVLVAALMAAWLALAASPAHATTAFTVNSTGDKHDLDFPGGTFDGSSDGTCLTNSIYLGVKECTLRAAIQEANVTPGADTIDFAIPGTGVATISPTSQLPTITEAVTINGYSQPGAKPNTLAVGNDAVLKVELSGPGAGSGLRIGAANSTVKGLAINGWGEGVHISESGATGNKVEGNYLGTDASGAQVPGNYHGVHIIEAPNNAVGGATAADRNIISGNDSQGVRIEGANATGNKVVGNYVGTDKNGTAPLANTDFGVHVSAPNNTIGGTTVEARNVISGNDSYGVAIEGVNAGRNQVTGNYVGIDASGTKDLGNHYGVSISTPYNAVGGATAGERNVVSGNDSQGVIVLGAGAKGNKVTGNYVGTDASGTKDLGNSQDGVFISAPNNIVGGATVGERNVISGNDAYGVGIYGSTGGNKVLGNYVGADASGAQDLGNSLGGVRIDIASNNTVGGATAGARNVISGNGGDGVLVSGANTTGNRVLSNSVSSNDGLGIDLLGGTENAAGATANDPKDPDTGPNGLQNKPVLTSAKTSSTSTTVRGTLNSTPNKTFRVEFFSSPLGTGDEGQALRGQKSVTTDGSGNASFAFSSTNKVEVGRRMTATATDPAGNTSEFSAAKTVVAQ
jgi:titin